MQTRLTPASKTAKQIRVASRLSKPSRGTRVTRDEQQSTETLSCGLRAKGEGRTRRRRAGGAARRPVYREQPSFRCCCERCRLMRGAVVRKHHRRNSASVKQIQDRALSIYIRLVLRLRDGLRHKFPSPLRERIARLDVDRTSLAISKVLVQASLPW